MPSFTSKFSKCIYGKGVQLATVAKHVAHPIGYGEVMSSILGPNRVIAKEINRQLCHRYKNDCRSKWNALAHAQFKTNIVQ